MKLQHVKVYWSPFATNVLDARQYELCTPDGKPVDFYQTTEGKFHLVIPGVPPLETFDNVQMSYYMNQYDIGGRKRT